MEIVNPADGRYEQGGEASFTGDVRLASGPPALDGTGLGIVHFAAGARTHWHRHAGGQLLYVLSGRGRIRSRGGEGHVLLPGDFVSIRAGEWHFHGGGPDSPMAHVSVNIGGAPEWGDPVTEAEYHEGF